VNTAVAQLSAAKARKVLGWQARTRLDDGLARTVEWYRGFLAGSR
jgi:nucleoside-diphosphate-sugar epimerase